MSWLFSRALVEAYSEENSSDGEPCAQLNLMATRQPFLRNGKTMDFSSLSRFGVTSEHLTLVGGGKLSTALLAAFLASLLARHREAGVSPLTFGRTRNASYSTFNRNGFLQKTFSADQSKKRRMILLRSGIDVVTCRLMRPNWVPHTDGRGGGWLPTPTATANHDAPSMRKWPAYKAYQSWIGKRTTPVLWEWLMGFPIGWTDLKPLETDRCLSVQRKLGAS